ncbi:MAG: hypothetical protein PHP88_03550 [bacterium]|nr:hypothetical protein [bacterium]
MKRCISKALVLLVMAATLWGCGDDPIPLSTPPLTGAVSPAIAAGSDEHTVALKGDGTVWAWGGNYSGQLGDNTTTQRTLPVQVTGLSGVAAIAAGSGHTVALKSDNTVWAWGYNGTGQLGDNTSSNRLMPVAVAGLSGVVAVAAGGEHTVALKSDNTMWAWGNNASGQLGDNSVTNRWLPVQVPGLSPVAAVSAGLYHTVALKSDGTVWAWGHNEYGQIGDNTTGFGRYKSVPAQVQGLSGVFVAVAAGAYHTVALKSDNTVWAWGNNASGQLGINQPNFGFPYPVPRQVTGLTGVVAIAAGFEHTFALKSDGTVWAWGSNVKGAFGNGTTASEIAPVQVTNFTGFLAVAPGFDFTVALKGDGTFWACGNNQFGELGRGTADLSAHPVPVQVTGL